MKLHLALLLLLAGLTTPAAHAQVVIDSSMDDWGNVPVLYSTPPALAMDSPLGNVEDFRAAYDRDYLFLQLVFAEPRPFLDPSHPEKLTNGVWDDFQYVEIDTNLDGKWDFQTQLTTGLRSGLNNLALLDSHPNGTPRQRVLYPEGHKNYMPLGPRASFGMRGRAVEMRLPREPLNIMKHSDIALRVRLRYRDNLNGSGKWVTEYLPRDAWIKFHIGTLAEAGETDPSAVPTAPRDEAARLLSESAIKRQEREIKQSYALPSITEANAEQGPRLIEPGQSESRHVAKDLPPIPPASSPGEDVRNDSQGETIKGRLPDGWEDRGENDPLVQDIPETAAPAEGEQGMPEWMKHEVARLLTEEENGTTSTTEIDTDQAGQWVAEDVTETSPSLTRGNLAISEVLNELNRGNEMETGPTPQGGHAGALPAPLEQQGLNAQLDAYDQHSPLTSAAQPNTAEPPVSLVMPANPTATVEGKPAAPPPQITSAPLDIEAQLDAYEQSEASDGIPVHAAEMPATESLTAPIAVIAPAVAPMATPAVTPQAQAIPERTAPAGALDIDSQLTIYEQSETPTSTSTNPPGQAAPTPQPTPQAVPQATPEIAEPQPISNPPAPVATPIMYLIPKPTPDLTPTPTPQPTLTPTPTPTVTPTPTPTPEVTPQPTPTPRPTPSPTPSPTPTPEPGLEVMPGSVSGSIVMQAIDAPIAQPDQEPITIDGRFDDWTQAEYVFTVPTQRKIAATHSIAIIDRVSLAASPGFLYVRLDFDQSHRAHLPGAAEARTLLDAGAYLRIEADGNALWDFEVRLVPKPIPGPQMANAIPCMVINAAGNTVLLPATDEHGRPDGPLACMDEEGKSVELRLPRAPLALDGHRPIFVRAMVRFLLAGNPWQTMYYPASDNWYAGDFSK